MKIYFIRESPTRRRLIRVVLAILFALIYQDALLSQVCCRHDIAEVAACDADLSINRKIETVADAHTLEIEISVSHSSKSVMSYLRRRLTDQNVGRRSITSLS
jgi:hypothetical protein